MSDLIYQNAVPIATVLGILFCTWLVLNGLFEIFDMRNDTGPAWHELDDFENIEFPSEETTETKETGKLDVVIVFFWGVITGLLLAFAISIIILFSNN